MSKTWYGHYIYADLVKGQEFVDYKDYLELYKIIDDLEKKNKLAKSQYNTYKLLINSNIETLLTENKRQRKVINHLSRKIQNKNKKYRQLQARKMPPTMYGNKVVIVPDSMADKIMVANKEFFDMGSDISNGKH